MLVLPPTKPPRLFELLKCSFSDSANKSRKNEKDFLEIYIFHLFNRDLNK